MIKLLKTIFEKLISFISSIWHQQKLKEIDKKFNREYKI